MRKPVQIPGISIWLSFGGPFQLISYPLIAKTTFMAMVLSVPLTDQKHRSTKIHNKFHNTSFLFGNVAFGLPQATCCVAFIGDHRRCSHKFTVILMCLFLLRFSRSRSLLAIILLFHTYSDLKSM